MLPRNALKAARSISGLAIALTATSAMAHGPGHARAAMSPMWPFTVVFDTPPPSARPRPGSACEAAEKYATFISTGQSEKVPALFAPTGEFIGPENRVLRGKEIATFYGSIQQRGAIAISFIDADRECIMELANLRRVPGSDQPKYKLSAVDHFTVGADGKITRLVIFFRDNVVTPPHPETGGAMAGALPPP